MLRPLDRETVRQALQTRWALSPDVAERLARLSGGRMGWAVRAATDPQAVQQLETAVALLRGGALRPVWGSKKSEAGPKADPAPGRNDGAAR